MELRERAVGSLIGLAVGDALGAPFEVWQQSGRVPDPIPAFELPWMGQPVGTWTDATAMARNLWLSLIAHGGDLHVDDVLARHLRWVATDPPRVGNIARGVLSKLGEGEVDAAREYVEQRGPEVSSGNGSVKYCAPLGGRLRAPRGRADEISALAICDHALG
jgi:ADP-ribosylglycohydrolase